MGRRKKNESLENSLATEVAKATEPPEFDERDCFAIESFAHDAIRSMVAPSADPPELVRWSIQCGQEFVRQMRQIRLGRGYPYPAEPLPPAEEAPPTPPDPPVKSAEELLREKIILRFPPAPGFCRHAAFADMGNADDVDAMLDDLLSEGHLEHEGLKGLRLTKSGEELSRSIVRGAS